MTILSPSAAAGPLTVSGAPVPIATSSHLVNKVSVKPRLGQWSKVLIGGPNLGIDESNAMAILYPVPNGGQADAFVRRTRAARTPSTLANSTCMRPSQVTRPWWKHSSTQPYEQAGTFPKSIGRRSGRRCRQYPARAGWLVHRSRWRIARLSTDYHLDGPIRYLELSEWSPASH